MVTGGRSLRELGLAATHPSRRETAPGPLGDISVAPSLVA